MVWARSIEMFRVCLLDSKRTDTPKSLFEFADRFFKLATWAVAVIGIYIAFFKHADMEIFVYVASAGTVIWFVALYAFLRGLLNGVIEILGVNPIIIVEICVFYSTGILIAVSYLAWKVLSEKLIDRIATEVLTEMLQKIK